MTARDTDSPLYLRVHRRLLAMANRRAAGDLLPTERDFAQQLGVSRITVRNAYAKLVEEGHVVKAHKAYKVAPQFRSSGIFMLEGFTRDSAARGFKPRTNTVCVELVRPSTEIAEALMIPPQARTYRLFRQRFLDDDLVAVEYASLSEALAPGLDRYPLNTLYGALRRRYGIRVHWARQWISFIFGPCRQRDELALPPEVPVLRLKRISLSEKNRPIEYVEGYYDMRKMEFYLELRR